MPADDEPTHEVTRRDALKKLGVATGIAWSAPVVMSFYTAAGAAPGSPSPTTSAETTTVPPPPDCTSGGTCSDFDPDAVCVCVIDAAGGGRLAPASFACSALVACGPGYSCPSDSFCALETCCTDPVCIPFSVLDQCPSARLVPVPPSQSRLRSGGPTVGSR